MTFVPGYQRRAAWLITGLLLIDCCMTPGSIHGEEQRLPATVARALREAAMPPASVSLFVQEVGGRRPRLEFNDEQPMNPASVMKLVTTYAALELLGPAFTWNTSAYANGSMQGDVLEGDLVLKGGGDPKLTLEN